MIRIQELVINQVSKRKRTSAEKKWLRRCQTNTTVDTAIPHWSRATKTPGKDIFKNVQIGFLNNLRANERRRQEHETDLGGDKCSAGSDKAQVK